MSRAVFSVAMTGEVDAVGRHHLLRDDEQEDIAFALWRPSTGRSRYTALITEIIKPLPGDRNVHGNASFNPQYLQRALGIAKSTDSGLALMHSHPLSLGWQGMSPDDIRAEQGNAGAVFGVTKKPFVGLTMAKDGSWSARFWERTAPRTYTRRNCATVRVIGKKISVSFYEKLAPRPMVTKEQTRTVSSWGDAKQTDLARIRIGVIGAGSVGGIIAKGLARTGFEDVMVIDFDWIEEHNLDRLDYATRRDIGELKIDVLKRHLDVIATASNFRCEAIEAAIFESKGFRAALDCDVIIACVDRPWGRFMVNLLAYAHLIPVVDGGIAVRTNNSGHLVRADWRAHTAVPGRICLECLGQFDSGLVQTEVEGRLDDPKYIEGLPDGHPLKARENVFAFSLDCAANQMLQLLAYCIAPLGRSNPGAQLYHFVGNITEKPSFDPCHENCMYPGLVAQGDNCGFDANGQRRPSQVYRPRHKPWKVQFARRATDYLARYL